MRKGGKSHLSDVIEDMHKTKELDGRAIGHDVKVESHRDDFVGVGRGLIPHA